MVRSAQAFLAILGGVDRRVITICAVGLCVAFGCWTEGFAPAAEAGGKFWVNEGEHVTIELVPMPKKYQNSSRGLLDLFAASPDSMFWYGPVKPNVHSWLGPSVICRDTTDFAIDICREAGDQLETLVFARVVPAFYRLGFREGNSSEPGFYTLRFRHADVVVYEARFKLFEHQ